MASPVCVAAPGAGETCQDECASGLECICADDACTSSTCRRIRLPGESCTDPNDACLPDATECQNGICVAVETQGLFESLCL
jgi:hypothetical protein